MSARRDTCVGLMRFSAFGLLNTMPLQISPELQHDKRSKYRWMGRYTPICAMLFQKNNQGGIAAHYCYQPEADSFPVTSEVSSSSYHSNLSWLTIVYLLLRLYPVYSHKTISCPCLRHSFKHSFPHQTLSILSSTLLDQNSQLVTHDTEV